MNLNVITAESPPELVYRYGGAKGGNLRTLTVNGIAVPRWAIIGTDVFACFLRDSGLGTELAALLTTVTPATAAEVAGRAAALIDAAEPGPGARRVVEAAYQFVDCERVAVRSSGADEDGADFSFAGQFDTFLNVRGAADVLRKTKACWASSLSARSLHYRMRHGLPPGPGAMAVIVQQMVPAERSGVLFTADPAGADHGQPDHGQPDHGRYVISSVYGLGEGLVSGAVDADTVVLDATSGEVLDAHLGDKKQRYLAASDTGCQIDEVPAKDQCVMTLDVADLALLTDAGRLVTEIFGCPQDIEWSMAGDRLWILQSRPITGPARPAFSDGTRIWDNSNIIESFSGIVSPLTYTFAAEVYAKTYEYYARALRVPARQLRQMNDWLPHMLGYFHGRVYYNLLHWYRMVGLAPGYRLNRKVLEISLGVEEPLPDDIADRIRPYVFSSAWRRRLSRTVTGATFAWRFLRMSRSVTAFTRYFYASYEEFDGVDYDALPGEETYRRFCRLERDLLEKWGPMMTLDATILLSLGALGLLTRRWLPAAPQWFTWAIASPGAGIESAEPARALGALAAAVRADAGLLGLVCAAAPEQARQAIAGQGYGDFLAALDDYVGKYGYRSPDELKLEMPDLREDPSRLFSMLRDAIEQVAPPGSPATAQEYLDAHLHGPRRWVYELVRRKARTSLADRERLRFCRTRAFGAAKRMLRAIGRELVRNGVIDGFEDVFQLRLDEIRGLFEGTLGHAEPRGLVAMRIKQRAADERMVAPSRFTTHGIPCGGGVLAAAGWSDIAAARTGARELRGTASSPGIAEGLAVVTTAPVDVRGGILIAYRTDPGWVAALPSAAGLVIERGSPLTHVAIVARELGIPTVVQLRGVTTEIQTGMRVRVDGGTGLVTVLDDVASPAGSPR
jgi:phosphohistidine swiveling domain-containing protein